ncbi:MAG: hypothetical protein LUE93_05120 [Bacteroides sp.]|nr:hypothetical protein [Bacteroides sp.]
MKRGTGYQNPWITLSTAPHLLFRNLSEIPYAIFHRKWNYLDKILQEISPSRPFFMIGILIGTIFFTFFDGWFSLKWWLLLFIIILFMHWPYRMP